MLQMDINDKMRAILVDWLVEVHLKFKVHCCCALFQAIADLSCVAAPLCVRMYSHMRFVSCSSCQRHCSFP